MKNSISKSVLAILAAGIALIAVILWFGHSTKPQPEPEIKSLAAAPVPVPAKPLSVPAPTVAKQNNGDLPPVIPISLTNIIDTTDETFFHNDAGMKSLPRGTQVYGGIEFWLQGSIQLQGLATRDDQHQKFRTNIDVPLDETNFTDGQMAVNERGKNISSIYFLGGTRYAGQSGQKFADLVWHYADGTMARSELRYNVHLRDWTRTPYEDPAQLPSALTKVAWHGQHPTHKTGSIRLYRVALVNPHPEKTIGSLEFASAMARPSLFVTALTLDPLLPGMRPDNLTSQEETDPELHGQLQLFVRDSGGHPLVGAQVSVASRSKPAGPINQKFTTDDSGTALVRYPDTDLQTLDVSANHDDYSGRKMTWDTSSGDTIPANYTLKLEGEVKIGGIVVDPENNPLSGAAISLYRFWSGGDMPNRKGGQPAFSTQRQTTDDQGRWQAKGLPPELLDHIGFDVKHPDFISTNFTVGADGKVERELRNGTQKTVMQRGLEVHGQVVDGSNNPISGATVWAGRKYSRDREQTQSDAQGGFFFHNVTVGDTLFSVMAKSYGPESKSVDVETNMSEVIFQLKPGSSITAHVQDESSQAVAGARVGLEGPPGDPSYDAYEFSANTDSQGNFTWDSSPDEPMQFYIFHDGFEAKRGIKLAPNQANTVTMRHSRQLQGQVIDATTQQPVTKFTVRTGTENGNNSDLMGAIRYKDFTAPDGRFTLSIEEENDNAVAVYADSYADQVAKFPDAQNGVVQVVVEMNPSPSLTGTVLAPDGTPAPGVNVIATTDNQHSTAQLTRGHLRSFNQHNKMATTDANGQFTIPSLPDSGTIVAAGDPGFAQMPLADVRSSGTIALQAWGRIEGTLKIGGQPGAGKDLLFNLTIPGISTDFNGYKSTTDDQGQFTMENVPPGDGAIVRLIQTSANSWTHSDSTPVTVKPGETTQITLGDNGAVLVGRIRFENPPTNLAALNIQGTVSGQMPQVPAFNSSADAQAYFQTPEYRALMKLHKNYAIEMNPDGSFTVDDVAPGNYSLNVTASLGGGRPWEHPPLGQGTIQVTVPDSFSPSSPIDIGEVVLNPVSRQ